MSTLRRRLAPAMIWSAMIILGSSVWGLGQESFGPAGKHIGRSTDWPRGVEQVLRHPSRVYWNDINGNEHGYYVSDISEINELLALFAKLDIARHDVVLRPGSSTVRSFEGLVVDYNVEFAVPSGIYLHHARSLAATGLYVTTPRMIIHVDEELMSDLDRFEVPEGVTMRDASYRVDDALRFIHRQDQSLRRRAVTLLGELKVSSENVVEALEELAAADPNLTQAAEDALLRIEEANAADMRPLRHQLASFLLNHPRRSCVPRSAELLELLRQKDQEYARGFTARGTMSVPASGGRWQLIAWTITMGSHTLVIQQRAVQDEYHPACEGLLEKTHYVDLKQMGTIHRSRLWVDDQLTATKSHATFEPVGATYDLLIGRMLWPLGRDFTRRIDEIEEVRERGDGTLAVTAVKNEGGRQLRWELTVDPALDYLIRSAKGYRHDETAASYVVDNVGELRGDGRQVAHTARYREGSWAQPVSMSVSSVSARSDVKLIRETAVRLEELKREEL